MDMELSEINNGNVFCKQSKKSGNVRIEIVKPGNYYLKKKKSSTTIKG